MHHKALSQVQLSCISCRTYQGHVIQHPLKLIPRETNDDYVLSGWLECTHCGKRYPIIDGVPVLLNVTSNGDEFVNQYIDAHYGNLDTAYWEEMATPKSHGLTLDCGCSAGRFTFECARNGFAVGLDVNLELLKIAALIQRTGQVEYSRKTWALGTEKKVTHFAPSDNALFILADIQNPPFWMETFDVISALNLLDSVKRPLTALGQMDAMLKPQGALFLSTPYVWNPEISEEWLETRETEPHEFLKLLLTGKTIPEIGFNYRIIEHQKNIPWRLQQQDALQFTYFVDKIVAKKLSSSGSGVGL